MPDPVTRPILLEILAALDLDESAVSRISFTGDDRLPSCFAVSDLAAASIGAAALAISELAGLGGGTPAPAPAVSVSQRLASLWFGWSIRPQGWAMPAPWDAIAGDYQARDGWIKLHTNAPHHRAAALLVLGCAATRDAVADAVAHWRGDDLEDAIIAAGGCAARLRSMADWASHPQGQAVAAEPLMIWSGQAPAPVGAWRPDPELGGS